jgi:tetratricopeptide (TPR) repeat protein
VKAAAPTAIVTCLCIMAPLDRGPEGPRHIESSSSAPANQQPPSLGSYKDLDAWLSAADRHVPGSADEAAEAIARWTADRLALTLAEVVALRKQMAIYAQRPSAEIRLHARRLQPREVEELCRITSEERIAADLNRVLRRGAVLHADIGRFAPDLPQPPGGRDILVRMSDARQGSIDPGTLHWRFGREVLGALAPDAATRRFVSAWYLATAAHLQAERMMTLAVEHLSHARLAVPDDPDILFAGACALESLASRRVQAELAAATLPPGYTFNVRPVRAMEGEAVALFGNVLARDPDRREARVRMARLIGPLGGHADALANLRLALQAPLPAALAYFAWLFTGDEELALDHREAAADAYERAAELFPYAPSPVVALARLAREYGDRPALARALERWWALPPDGLDPWRHYYLMQGLDVEERMRNLYALAGGRRQ